MGSSARLMIFANRSAGTLLKPGGQPPLATLARQAGLDPEIVYARGPRHLQRLLRERVVGKVNRVAVAGGDGTVRLAAQVLAGTDVALGILPQGTANNFATALRLPRDLPSALRVLAQGVERRVDLGQVGEEYFTEAAGVGVFADLLAVTGASHRLIDRLRGIAVVARVLALDQARRMTLVIDGERQVENVLNVTVANSFLVGYNIPIAPEAKVTDAKLDVVVIESLTRREMMEYYRAIGRQEHLELPKVQSMKAREVRLSARHAAAVHVDDRTSLRTPVTIRVAPRALRVLTDRLEPPDQPRRRDPAGGPTTA